MNDLDLLLVMRAYNTLMERESVKFKSHVIIVLSVKVEGKMNKETSEKKALLFGWH